MGAVYELASGKVITALGLTSGKILLLETVIEHYLLQHPLLRRKSGQRR